MKQSILSAAAVLSLLAASVSSGAKAQATPSDPHHPSTTLAQATPGQGSSATSAQSGMMQPGAMGHGMMGQDMMCGMMRSGMMDGMGGMPMMGPRGHMMKVMFAIADTNGDGALSFEEVTAIHKRIFDRVDANKDGKVTPEELQAFMRE
jgi:hypothetical protein